ncbi:MAG: hypothetical protein BWY83_02186 [bacterium ADurb.Bin478]|nr:MAG: hypothetical protein BWY83_02186 [bacterium ADurb.Bin478]
MAIPAQSALTRIVLHGPDKDANNALLAKPQRLADRHRLFGKKLVATVPDGIPKELFILTRPHCGHWHEGKGFLLLKRRIDDLCGHLALQGHGQSNGTSGQGGSACLPCPFRPLKGQMVQRFIAHGTRVRLPQRRQPEFHISFAAGHQLDCARLSSVHSGKEREHCADDQ